jgi:hypothetical protein
LGMIDLYKFLLREQQCFQLKDKCEHNCAKCSYYTNSIEAHKNYNFLIDLIKARSPGLMFADRINYLNALIENGGLSQDGTSIDTRSES